jgi:hypothetical protein
MYRQVTPAARATERNVAAGGRYKSAVARHAWLTHARCNGAAVRAITTQPIKGRFMRALLASLIVAVFALGAAASHATVATGSMVVYSSDDSKDESKNPTPTTEPKSDEDKDKDKDKDDKKS